MNEDDATIRRMARSGRTDCEIGKAIGRDRQWVRRRRLAMGVEPGYGRVAKAMIARLNLRRMCARVTV